VRARPAVYSVRRALTERVENIVINGNICRRFLEHSASETKELAQRSRLTQIANLYSRLTVDTRVRARPRSQSIPATRVLVNFVESLFSGLAIGESPR
jgi:hypothetical protein